MPPRTPPGTGSITETALAADRGRLRGDRAIGWESVLDLIKTVHHTTRSRAAGWLLEAVTAEDSEIVAVWNHGSVLTGTDGRTEALTAWGYPLTAILSLNLAANGARIPIPDTTTKRVGKALWVVRRDTLVAMLDLIVTETESRNRERAEEERRARDTFATHHGDALPVIESALGFLDDPDDAISISNRHHLAGPPGTLHLKLSGAEIDRFAELCRRGLYDTDQKEG